MTDETPETRPLPILDQTIRAAVERELGTVQPDSRVAFVALADLRGARTAVLVRIGAGWSFSGYLDKPYHGTLEGGASLRFEA